MSVAGSLTMTAVALLMTPCSALVSFIMRDINSPVLVRLKKPADKIQQMLEEADAQVGDGADGDPLEKINVEVGKEPPQKNDRRNDGHQRDNRPAIRPRMVGQRLPGGVQPIPDGFRHQDLDEFGHGQEVPVGNEFAGIGVLQQQAVEARGGFGRRLRQQIAGFFGELDAVEPRRRRKWTASGRTRLNSAARAVRNELDSVLEAGGRP